MRKNSERLQLDMSEKYWCLFCGESGPSWNTSEELFEHMKTTVHKTKGGGLVFFTGDKSGQNSNHD